MVKLSRIIGYGSQIVNPRIPYKCAYSQNELTAWSFDIKETRPHSMPIEFDSSRSVPDILILLWSTLDYFILDLATYDVNLNDDVQ